MRTTKIRGACPFCYRQMISATDIFGTEQPEHGDIALCGQCGEPSMFDFSMRKNILRKPTAREALDIEKNATANGVRAHQAARAA